MGGSGAPRRRLGARLSRNRANGRTHDAQGQQPRETRPVTVRRARRRRRHQRRRLRGGALRQGRQGRAHRSRRLGRVHQSAVVQSRLGRDQVHGDLRLPFGAQAVHEPQSPDPQLPFDRPGNPLLYWGPEGLSPQPAEALGGCLALLVHGQRLHQDAAPAVTGDDAPRRGHPRRRPDGRRLRVFRRLPA